MSDPDIAELKKMVAETLEVVRDTNDAVHTLRRQARWGMFFRFIYWIVIIVILGASYVFVTPYLTQLQKAYSELQTSLNKVQGSATDTQNYLQGVIKKLPPL